MAKSSNQKLKLLYLIDMFENNTDSEHIITMKDILAKLEANDIKAERKSIYDDIEALRLFGYDIEMTKNPTGYYLASRQFELPELKMLVDSVQSSKFLSENKSNQLIKKLEKFCSKYEATHLQRQVFVADRVKTPNESIYYNVDEIHKALSSNKCVGFRYLEWTDKKKLETKKDGKTYLVSPVSLVWSDENYYLVAYDTVNEKIKHYRVDKMKDIEISDQTRVNNEYVKNFNLAKFSKSTFGMYGGEEVSVEISFTKKFIGVMIDRFGADIPIIPLKTGGYKTAVKVAKSSQFYGWLTGLGPEVVIEGPDEVIKEYKKYLKEIVANYKK